MTAKKFRVWSRGENKFVFVSEEDYNLIKKSEYWQKYYEIKKGAKK